MWITNSFYHVRLSLRKRKVQARASDILQVYRKSELIFMKGEITSAYKRYSKRARKHVTYLYGKYYDMLRVLETDTETRNLKLVYCWRGSVSLQFRAARWAEKHLDSDWYGKPETPGGSRNTLTWIDDRNRKYLVEPKNTSARRDLVGISPRYADRAGLYTWPGFSYLASRQVVLLKVGIRLGERYG